ncbi:MAG TPA: hypothetical protein VGM91_23510 [Conexibacter sp.]
MQRLLGSAAVPLIVMTALAMAAALLPSASAQARPKPPPTLRCGALPKIAVAAIETEVVGCDKGRAVARAHERSVARGAACRLTQRICRVGCFLCTPRGTVSGATRILCIDAERKVTFEYPAPA